MAAKVYDMSIASAILSIPDWIKDKLPIPGRLEGIKNEIDKLENERKELLHGDPTLKTAKRTIWIDDRLKLLYGRLRNATGSS